jgi:hypothetical protein
VDPAAVLAVNLWVVLAAEWADPAVLQWAVIPVVLAHRKECVTLLAVVVV